MPNVPFYANPPNDDGWKAFAVVLLPRKIDTSSLFNGAPGTGRSFLWERLRLIEPCPALMGGATRGAKRGSFS